MSINDERKSLPLKPAEPMKFLIFSSRKASKQSKETTLNNNKKSKTTTFNKTVLSQNLYKKLVEEMRVKLENEKSIGKELQIRFEKSQ
jgi:hypothetical protein